MRVWTMVGVLALLSMSCTTTEVPETATAPATETEAETETASTAPPTTSSTTAPTNTTSTTAPTTTTTTEAPTTTTTTDAPAQLEDFTLVLIVLENQCFGSAGGRTTVEPDLSIPGTFGGGDYTLIYEIHGGEYGTETYNLDIHDDGTYTYDQETISTANCSDELTVEPVRLIER